jgi:hypothetical protein
VGRAVHGRAPRAARLRGRRRGPPRVSPCGRKGQRQPGIPARCKKFGFCFFSEFRSWQSQVFWVWGGWRQNGFARECRHHPRAPCPGGRWCSRACSSRRRSRSDCAVGRRTAAHLRATYGASAGPAASPAARGCWCAGMWGLGCVRCLLTAVPETARDHGLMLLPSGPLSTGTPCTHSTL